MVFKGADLHIKIDLPIIRSCDKKGLYLTVSKV